MKNLAARLVTGLLALSACFASQLSSADQFADIKAAGKLRIAIINGLPSFSVTDPKAGFTGSDVDTARLLAKDLGLTPEFVFVTNADRIDAMESKKADLIISALSITPEREQLIAFSVPYSSIALIIAAPRQYAITSYADLRGKKVGVGRNTSNGSLLKQNSNGVEIIEYEDERSLIEGYLKGQFDIISCQHATLKEINNMVSDRRLEAKFIQREFQIAVGMRKSERALREWVNNWVVSNLANGRLNDIFRRHHGHELPESVLPKQVVPRRI
ncbi:transporter substrate-binding domain-containing protein [Uliginosibacterium flavum]|uniref:Transporter substrate-binding domain-containing protein n=1 Tax=Uliginosibacterium flavum TaxID=1396831 RepID=A0ABV2TFU7_9RHOO